MERTFTYRSLLILLLIAVIAAAILLRQCGVSSYPVMSENTVSRKVEPVDIPVALPPISVQKDSIREKIVWRTKEVPVTDSAEVLRLVSERDSLRKLLAVKGVGITFGIDTIHAVTHDTVHVLCNEISRSVIFAYHPAPRIITTERETITITQQRRWGVGGTAGATFTMPDGHITLRLGATIGLTYIIF